MEKAFNTNILPSPTWRWLNVNGINLSAPLKENRLSDIFIHPVEKRKGYEIIEINPGEDGIFNTVNLSCGAHSKSEFILDFTSDGQGKEVVYNIDYDLDEAAELTLIQVQRMQKQDTLRTSFTGKLGDNAKLNVIQVFLGGCDTYSEIQTALCGEGASFSLSSAYRLGNGQKLDINYVIDHYGKNTVCDLKSLGILYEGAEKTYRGTIDFKRGCKGASGNETEDVLLMDDNVINKTVPVILCAEEDVFGNHGATIGRVSDEMMFYLMSRGLSEQQIYDVLAAGRVESVVRLIPDEKLREELGF